MNVALSVPCGMKYETKTSSSNIVIRIKLIQINA